MEQQSKISSQKDDEQRMLHHVIAHAITVARDRSDGADLAEAAVAAAKAFRAGLDAYAEDGSTGAYKNYPRAKLSDYVEDGYPRSGCTMVVELDDKEWRWRVYAPGFAPGRSEGVIDSFHSQHGSLGFAIDGFVRGVKDMRTLRPEMIRMEKAYEGLSESNVSEKHSLNSMSMTDGISEPSAARV